MATGIPSFQSARPPVHNPEPRESAASRGYGSKWQKARLAYLQEYPLCAECHKTGRITPATVVDHITPHKGDMQLFWDRGNWQPLCASHHSQKTAREDGGFGNTIKRT